MVLVIPKKGIKGVPGTIFSKKRYDSISQTKSNVDRLRLLHEQLLLLPKASTNAEFILKEHTTEDDDIQQTYW